MRKAAIGGGVIVLAAAIFLATRFTRESGGPATPEATSSPAAPVRSRATPPDEEAERETADNTARGRMERDWQDLLDWLESDPRPGPEEIRARLKALRIAWVEIDPQVRAEIIGKLLQGGKDAATGMDFQVGSHGQLAGWPTLRVFLLDVLATSDAEMAAAIARNLLATTTSADEYATALRSLTREILGRADDAELLSRFDTMLAKPEWQSSRGFAEALDLARLLGTADAARRVVSWNGGRVLKQSVMQEFAAEHPGEMIDALAADGSITGPTRATLMARADPTDARQLDAIDAYLKNPALSPEEATAFLDVFPFRSATTGHRLYAETPAPFTYDELRAADAAALARAGQWLADPALEKYQPQLQALQKRLQTWMDQKD